MTDQQTDTKPWYRNKWMIIIGTLIVIGTIGAITGKDDSPAGSPTVTTSAPDDTVDADPVMVWAQTYAVEAGQISGMIGEYSTQIAQAAERQDIVTMIDICDKAWMLTNSALTEPVTLNGPDVWVDMLTAYRNGYAACKTLDLDSATDWTNKATGLANQLTDLLTS